MLGRFPVVVVGLLLIVSCSTRERTSQDRQGVTTCVTLDASGDSYVSAFQRHQNFGARPHLRVGFFDESLVQFDLGSIPASAAIDSARLDLFVVDYDSHAPVNLHRITAPWTEGEITYSRFGQRFETTSIAGFTAVNDRSRKSIDLTAQVRRWVTNVQPNYGLLLETRSLREVTMVSRDGGTPSQRPELVVCYTEPDDHCSPNPCDNGGTCDNNPSGFTCTCAAGYTGPTCETEIDNCAADPCQHGGTCTNQLDGYTCACPTGYTGTNCETLIDNCAAAPCVNDGICENQVGTYTCHCAIGYTGTNCETVVDSCATGPCVNGGTCTNGTGTYTCSCPVGFTGTNCEVNIDDCANMPCQNGGTCIDGINAYTCACAPGWGGDSCEVNLDLCAQHPCLNGGTCNDGYGVYTCDCAAGFTGTNCEIDINDCAVNTCQHGGTCIDGVNSYTCQCAPGYTGTNCEQFGCATALDGTPCDDSNACTQTDSCQAGVCVGSNPIGCAALDQCHAVGVCDPVTALCSNPPQSNGTACSDGNGCTVSDACTDGACASGAPLVCDGTCDPQNGVCTPFPPISVGAVSVGAGLQTTLAVALTVPASGDVAVTVTSADPTKVLMSTSATQARGASVVITVADGNVASATPIYVQALSDTGTADVIVSAPGYSSQSASVTLQPSAFFVVEGSFSTTPSSGDTALTIVSATVANGARGTSQAVASGTTVDVTVAVSDPTIGAIATNPVHFAGGDSTATTAFHPIAGGSTAITVQAPPGFTTPTTGAQITATVNAPHVTLLDVTVGQNLEVPESASLGAVAPPGGAVVTVASADPSRMVVATSATATGSGTITLSVPAGSSTIPQFFVQGLVGTGTVGLTVSAPGFTAFTAKVTLSPAAIFFLSTSFSTTTLSANTTLTLVPAVIVGGNRGGAQPIRGGLNVAVDVTSAAPGVGMITTSPVHMVGGTTFATTAFDPVDVGTTALSIATPAGFSTPTSGTEITATVTVPSFIVANPQIGKDLEVLQNDLLNAPAPAGGVVVTITSNDPTKALVTSNATAAGSASIQLTVAANTTAIPVFYIQALGNIGTSGVTLSAPGFTSATATLTFLPSAIWLFTGNITTTAHSADTSLTVLSAPIVNGSRAGSQLLRGGLTVPVVVATADPTVGTITVSPVLFPGGATTATTAFHPLVAGSTTVTMTAPVGFQAPSGNTITATVTP